MGRPRAFRAFLDARRIKFTLAPSG